MDDERRSDALASGRRQGHEADGRALPAAPRSAWALNRGNECGRAGPSAMRSHVEGPLYRRHNRDAGGPMNEIQKHFERKSRVRAAVCTAVATLLVITATAVQAQTPNASDIAAGSQLYRQKGNCQACHGWAGDGRKMDNQMPDGANLRETKLERKDLIAAIKCGRPGTGMPAFDRLGYSDGRCYGLKLADLRARNLTLSDPPSTLQPNEIALLADFLLLKIVGKGAIDRAACVDFWGSDVQACN